MSDRYRLGRLENDRLLAAISELVRRENDSLSDLLAHLGELDERRLCLGLGYSSLFAYCREALGFSKSSAGRRIAAARVCRKYPEAFIRVAQGQLELSVLCALGQYLTASNAEGLFEVCSGRSYEQVEELLAARFPKPEVRDLIRRLPARSGTTLDIESAGVVAGSVHVSFGVAAASVNASLEMSHDSIQLSGAQNAPAPKADELAAAPAPAPPALSAKSPASARGGVIKPLAVDRYSVNFTADTRFRELLEEVRALVSHSEPNGDLLSVMTRALEALKEQLLKSRFGVGRKPRMAKLKNYGMRTIRERAEGSASSALDEKHGILARGVPACVARAVYVRDQGQCTFCAEDGRRCSERRLLQLDHVVLYSNGGEPSAANLRMRCRAHNLHTARLQLGDEHIRAAMARQRTALERRARPHTASPTKST